MARVSTYLNFSGCTEEAFNFYRKIFKTEFTRPFGRMGDVPQGPGSPKLTDAEKKLVMHVELPILAGHALMGTDTLESMGHKAIPGNQVTITLEPDTRAEAKRLYEALGEGVKDLPPLQDMFWGALWGTVKDKYGIGWMINCYAKQ